MTTEHAHQVALVTELDEIAERIFALGWSIDSVQTQPKAKADALKLLRSIYRQGRADGIKDARETVSAVFATSPR